MSSDLETEEYEGLTDSDLSVIDSINEERDLDNGIDDDSEDISVDKEEENSQDIDSESVEQSTQESTISNEMRQAAEYYGLSPDDFGSNEALGRVVDQFILGEQQFQQVYNQQNAQQQAQNPQGDNVPSATEVAAQFKIGLGDDYDEGLRTAIDSLSNNIVGSFDSQVQELRNQINYQKQFVDQAYNEQSKAIAQTQLDEFNNAVSGLKHKALFGDQSFQSSDANSNEAVNMSKLYDQMTVMATGYQQSGIQVPEYQQLVEQAYRAIFGNEIDSLKQHRTNDRLRKAASRRLGGGKSTSKIAPPPSDDPVNDPVLKDAFEGYLRDNGDL